MDRNNGTTYAKRRRALKLLKEGKSLRRIGSILGMSHQWVKKIAERNGVKLQQVQLPQSRREKLINALRSGETITSAARIASCSKSTASQYNRRIASEDGIVFNRTRSVRRCPEHGLVNTWPCVACAAKRGR